MVADLLRVQALFYLANPFNALGHALLVRRLDFKRQARIDLVAAALSAVTALGCALAGPRRVDAGRGARRRSGTRAPPAISSPRGSGRSGRASRFEGAGTMLRYGAAMVAVQACWFVQSQADIFIGGRRARCRTGSASTPPPCS